MIKLIFLIQFLFISLVYGEIPRFIPRCDITSSTFKDCVLKASNSMRPFLKTGIPELHIPPIDPLVIPEMILSRRYSDNVYTCKFFNVTLDNLLDYKFTNFQYNLTDNEADFQVEGLFESIPLKAIYDLNTKILSIRINGEGNFEGIFRNMGFKISMVNNIVTRNGKRYMKMKSVNTNLEFSSNNVLNFERFTFDNPALAQAVIRFFQDNNDLVLEEAKGPISDAISTIILEIAQKVLKNNSFEDIFGVK